MRNSGRRFFRESRGWRRGGGRKLLIAKNRGVGHSVPSFFPQPPSSRGLGRQVLILVTPVRIRLGVPTSIITNRINGYASIRRQKKRHPLTLTSNGSTRKHHCRFRLPVSVLSPCLIRIHGRNATQTIFSATHAPHQHRPVTMQFPCGFRFPWPLAA